MSAEDAPTISDSQFEVSLGNVGPGTRVFGRYRLEKELGRGGMGVVWLAHDERVDLQVALKFLPDVVARDTEAVDELKRELRRGLNLTHPSIVRVYSFEQDPSGAAIAMEYVDGPTLSSLKLKQEGGCFDVDDLLPLVEQLCAALEYAHTEAKIVHRDIKPRNLMLTSRGRLKIADFGVATSISDTVSRVTIRRDGSGTPPYMSPQQAFGEDPSPSDDIYSVGATLYELLTGRAPFYQGNILAQVQQRVPPAMQERREVLKVIGKKPIAPGWEATIAACLAKHPEDRPQRAGEMLEMLKGERPAPANPHTASGPINPALSSAPQHPTAPIRRVNDDDATTLPSPGAPPHEPVTSRGDEAPPPPRKKRSKAGGLIVLALLIGLGAAVVWWQKEEDARSQAESRELQARLAMERTPVATPVPEPGPGDEATREAESKAAAAGVIPMTSVHWENSLQMKFIPVEGIAPLVSVFETRVQDYRAFAVETKRGWPPTEFIQGEDHPAVNVSWIDAVSFCDWLTRKERAEGRLGKTQRYRLLTDAEWSRAAGLGDEPGTTPQEKDRKNKEIYPWGTESVPPSGTENLAGEGETVLPDKELLGYTDGYSHTAGVGHFHPTKAGLYDLGGNVSEWVEDWFDARHTERTTRGAAFIYIADFDRCSSFRWHRPPEEFADYIGFRVALDTAGVK